MGDFYYSIGAFEMIWQVYCHHDLKLITIYKQVVGVDIEAIWTYLPSTH